MLVHVQARNDFRTYAITYKCAIKSKRMINMPSEECVPLCVHARSCVCERIFFIIIECVAHRHAYLIYIYIYIHIYVYIYMIYAYKRLHSLSLLYVCDRQQTLKLQALSSRTTTNTNFWRAEYRDTTFIIISVEYSHTTPLL